MVRRAARRPGDPPWLEAEGHGLHFWAAGTSSEGETALVRCPCAITADRVCGELVRMGLHEVGRSGRLMSERDARRWLADRGRVVGDVRSVDR